ncbi:hypothetical protein CDV55_100143 [Aspergillus turcosus]|uniref:NACHT-NTPase and P-loop NTPases N-terminal domain-containing protein n=1 Tax=Aspergillus turcosus TaxID=1245748 RepID=A0A229YE31_9EURO|nr:hypothetical protein CDV55_100143 [Aspergillus turcosus]RLL95730.1 hypothetical protein CFD26_105960 [Aspergillus turcosus]
MEALAAISLVGNIVQFVDFSSKLISTAAQLYHSREDALTENINIEAVTNDLVLLNNKLEASAPVDDIQLVRLSESCKNVAYDLLAVLDKVKVKVNPRYIGSIRKAFRSVWSREDIEKLQQQLAMFREELNLHVCVDLRDQIRKLKLEQDERLKDLDSVTQRIVHAITEQQNIYHAALEAQRTGQPKTKETSFNVMFSGGDYFASAVVGKAETQAHIQGGTVTFSGTINIGGKP